MNDNQFVQTLQIQKIDNMKKTYFSNVFTKMGKSEKGKKYQNLQIDINHLTREVKLLEEYNPGIKLSKKKILDNINTINNDTQYNKIHSRKGLLLNKEKNKKYLNLINGFNNNITSQDNINESYNNKSKKYKKLNNIINLKYKLEENNEPNLHNKNKLININLDKLSESDIDTINNNISSSSRLPNINNKSQHKLYLFTENNITERKSIYPNNNIYRKFYAPKKNVSISRNTFIKKFPNIFDNENKKYSFNKEELGQSTEKISKMLNKKNDKIKKKINSILVKHDLLDLRMKSRIKLIQWKYGTDEIDKYFVDLKAFGKKEEDEIIKRKKFYDIVEDVMDEIKQERDERDINDIKKRYLKKENKAFDEFKKNEKKIEENNDLNIMNNVLNKFNKVNQDLERIKIRKKNEQKKRDIIKKILIRNELRRQSINDSNEKIIFG